MSRKEDIISNIVLVIILLVGLSVMLYPSFSDWWNKRVQSHVVASYQEAVAQLSKEDTEKLLQEAKEYNKELAALSAPFAEWEKLNYYDVLDVAGNGILGFITVPAINIELPIYHGTSPAVLNIAAGHMEGSSFPVSGKDVHAVISAHRGLPSARLFTDLDKIVVGDIFTITVLDDTYTYEVEEIFTVRPDEMDKLEIIPNKEYTTLMTCTPYGINTHRLLIRSKRIETMLEMTAKNVKVDADALKVDEMVVIPFVALPLVLTLVFFWSIGGNIKSKRTKKDYLTIISRFKEVN